MKTFKKSIFSIAVHAKGRNPGLTFLYNTLNGAFAIVESQAWSAFGYEPFQIDHGNGIEAFIEQGLIVPTQTDETAVFQLWNQQLVHDYSTVKSKILVTRKCNLACTYCIIDHEPSVMTPETAWEMDRFYIDLIREKSPSRVMDNYLGGEPLLNTRVIMESAGRRFFFCNGKGIDYGFSITTNGTLITLEIIKDLVKVGLSGLRVSLAGPRPIHDRLRPSKKGKGTHALILENLKKISGLVPLSIECQYDSGTEHYRQIPEMMDELFKEGISIENIAFTPILPKRKNNQYPSGYGKPEILRDLHREAAARGLPVLEQPPRSGCMADFRSQLVFDTDGSIIPCPSLQGAEMAYGHVSSGIDFIRESQLMNRQLPFKCYQCPILPLCRGGCRLQALTFNGDFNGIDCHREAFEMQLEEYIRQKGGRFLERNEKRIKISPKNPSLPV